MQIDEDNERDRQKFLLDDKERSDLINALKKKWEVVHREYQTLTHKGKLDTLGIKNKKENCEKELAQLEKDIAKLSKNFIFVDTTMQAYWAEWRQSESDRLMLVNWMNSLVRETTAIILTRLFIYLDDKMLIKYSSSILLIRVGSLFVHKLCQIDFQLPNVVTFL